VGQFFLKCRVCYNEYLPVLLKYLLSRVADTEEVVLSALRDCMTAMVASVSLDEVSSHIEFIRNCISSTASAAKHKTGGAILLSASGEFMLPLFTLPKSLDPFFAIFSHGLLNGNAFIKELSADMIAECSGMADAAVLKPTLIKVVGSLIRIVGDRYPSSVKSAILHALIALMNKGGSSLKAFVPQLQSTFVKALNDPLREVRQRGGKALGQLLLLGPRPDPLLSDLSQLCLQVDSHAIRVSVLEALGTVLTFATAKASPAALLKVTEAMKRVVVDEDDFVRLAAARCMGLASIHLEQAQLSDLLLDLIGDHGASAENNSFDWIATAGKVVALACVLQGAGSRGDEFRGEVYDFMNTLRIDERVSVKVALAR
jgi:hypothetical protein